MVVREGEVAEAGVGRVSHHKLIGAEGVHLCRPDEAHAVPRADACHVLHVLEGGEDARRGRIVVSAQDRADEGLELLEVERAGAW